MVYSKYKNELIKILQGINGIRYKLCENFGLDYEENKELTVRQLLDNYGEFKNGKDDVLQFVYRLNKEGVIDDSLYEEYLQKVNENKIENILFLQTEKLDYQGDISTNKFNLMNSDKVLVFQKKDISTIMVKDIEGYFSEINLKTRIDEAIKSDNETVFFNAYNSYMKSKAGIYEIINYPALLPQFSLKSRTKTIFERNGCRDEYQIIDFGMCLNNKIILIEIDGYEHYSDKYVSNCCNVYYNANFNRISNERKIDRELLMEGYELYRFTNKEIADNKDNLDNYLGEFFDNLFKKHGIEIQKIVNYNIF